MKTISTDRLTEILMPGLRQAMQLGVDTTEKLFTMALDRNVSAAKANKVLADYYELMRLHKEAHE